MYLSGEQDKEIQIEITNECLFERHKLSDENLSQIIKKTLKSLKFIAQSTDKYKSNKINP